MLVEELQVDLSVALRFARARQGDFTKAKPFLQADLVWRAMKTPVTQGDCPTALASGNLRMLGCTTTGLPVVFIQVGLWDPSKYGVSEYERYLIYFFDNVLLRGGGEQFVLIFDLHGWKLSHVAHMRKTARLISTVQDHYPDRLAKCLLMRVPGIFARAWGTIKNFMDDASASKVVFVGASPEAEKVAFDAIGAWELIPSSYGGPREGEVPVPNIPGEENVSLAPPLEPTLLRTRSK